MPFNLVPHQYVTIVPLGNNPAVPDDLAAILNQASAEEAAYYLLSFLYPYDIGNLDAETSYDKANNNSYTYGYFKVSNWCSGGGMSQFSASPYRFEKDSHTIFF